VWWPQIEKLAPALYVRGTLTAPEIEAELAWRRTAVVRKNEDGSVTLLTGPGHES
jgi:hypothetical protein